MLINDNEWSASNTTISTSYVVDDAMAMNGSDGSELPSELHSTSQPMSESSNFLAHHWGEQEPIKSSHHDRKEN